MDEMKKVLAALSSLAKDDTSTAHPDATLSAICAKSGLDEKAARAALMEAFKQGLCAKCPEGGQVQLDDAKDEATGKMVRVYAPVDPCIQIYDAGVAWLQDQ